jgi:hypothetical protein
MDVVPDVNAPLSCRAMSGTATPPATRSQSDGEMGVVPSRRRSGEAVIAAR